MRTYIVRLSFVILALILLCSCAKDEETDIVIRYESAEAAAQAVGFSSPDYIPDEFSVKEHNVIYGIVSETVFTRGDDRAVLRAVNAQYSVSNLSGYLDTALSDVYTSKDGREFEIEYRDGIYAVEWQDKYLNEEYNFSYTRSGCELSEFRADIKELLSVINSEES